MACSSCNKNVPDLYQLSQQVSQQVSQQGDQDMPIMPNSPAAAATPDPEAVAFATKILTDANTAGLTTNQFRTAVQIATNTLNNQKVQVPPPPAPAAPAAPAAG